MGKLSAFVSALVIASLVLGSSALAGSSWCAADPVFAVNGTLVDITTAWSLADQPYAVSASFELQVPVNVTAAVVSLPGTVPVTGKVSYVLPAWDGTGDIPVVSLVTIKGAKSFDISTRISGTWSEIVGNVGGKANKTQNFSFSLGL
jgi:hypothetical protein